MGVTVPLGFGMWRLPIRLVGDAETMYITCGFVDDDIIPPSVIAQNITAPLLATPTFAASTVWQDYSMGPGEVTVTRLLGTFEGVGTTTRTGTNTTTTVLPQNVAVLVKKITARGGRHGRGRMFLPPFMFGEASVTPQGVIATSQVNQITTDFQTWRASLAGGSTPLQLLHQAPPVGPAIPPDVIEQFICSNIVATQRTRLRR
jgi:hypothetical protein